MGHGFPDWGAGAPLATVYTLQDMAELAARLGSIVTFDRRGNVILLENFEGSLSKCLTYAGGTGASVGISNKVSRSGSFSCKLTTGSAAEDIAYVKINLPFPVLSKMGLEVAWYITTSHTDIELYLEFWDGTYRYQAVVAWDHDDSQWYYVNSAGEWVAMGEPIDLIVDNMFNVSKLVIDLNSKKYVRFISNNVSHDLSDQDLYRMDAYDAPHLNVYAQAWNGTAGYNRVVYIDDVIITQNEP